MSDFDREAERERLREKYEHDQNKREATEQMSELLLKGATMTNAHCSECGDPIFRYDGQEFCPTCEKAVERDTGGDSDGESADEDRADDTDQERIEVADPSQGARVAFGGDADQSTSERSTEAPDDAAAKAREQAGEQHAGRYDREDSTTRRTREPQSDRAPRRGRERDRRGARPVHGDGIAAARESLVEALVRFSEDAAATDDPRRAEDHLAAAREAAEALDALDR
jgi:uncharacterized Zn finger protein (UPF0148 family)